MSDERIQTPDLLPDDEVDLSLRPISLDDFVGQDAVCGQLQVAIEAARGRQEPLDHVLLAGPPGLGKTSLARIVAEEMGVPFVPTAGPALEKKADVAAVLSALEPGSVLFVDEIHRLPKSVEETFYPAMEDRRLPITVGQGPGARIVTLEIPAFTMIGATTRAGSLSRPLRDRFGLQFRLEHYEVEDLSRIVSRSAGLLGLKLSPGGAVAIASRSRGTPRVANRLLRRVRDHAQVGGHQEITETVAVDALGALDVDSLGLDRLDREILRAICVTFRGGPVGLSTLGAAISEETDTLEDVYEPFLLKLGLIERTPRGRVATARAYEHLGLPRDGSQQLGLDGA
ncbi:MAG: Holliday junction branch migration DNA helicase RuvB [Actinomycetes bacterium]